MDAKIAVSEFCAALHQHYVLGPLIIIRRKIIGFQHYVLGPLIIIHRKTIGFQHYVLGPRK